MAECIVNAANACVRVKRKAVNRSESVAQSLWPGACGT